MKFKSKTFLQATAIALVTSVGLSACSSGNGSSGSSTPPPMTVTPPTPAPSGTVFGLTGTVSKGLILNGQVTVTDASNAATTLATGRTSADDGTYSVNIPATAEFTGPFVKVTVTGGGGAQMVCDSGDGCLTSTGESVAFGESFAIGETVSLSAIVPTPPASATQNVNLTIFSDLAASLVEAGAGGVSDTAVQNADAQVSDIFGLTTGTLSNISPLNLNEAATVGSQDDLKAAALSGGVLAAAFENGSDIGAALTKLRADFATNEGQLVVNEAVDDPALISLEDILGGAVNTGSSALVSSEEFSRVKAELLGAAIVSSGEASGALTEGQSTPANTDSALDQAKAFISDLQLVIEALESDANEDSFVAFADRVETAGRLLEDDAESALEAALKAGQAIVEAYSQYQDDPTLTSVTVEGITVDITSADGVPTYNVAPQIVEGSTVQLTLTGDLNVMVVETEERMDSADFSSGSGSDSSITTIGGDGSLTGSVENDAVEVEILGGTISVADGLISNASSYEFESDSFSSSNQDTETVLIKTEQASAQLEIKLAQKTENGLSFEGVAEAALVAPDFDGSTTYFNDQDNRGFITGDVVSQTASIKSANLGFSGKLSEGGESVEVSLAVELDANRLGFSNSADPVVNFSYSIEDGELLFPGVTRSSAFELISFEQMESEVLELIEDGLFDLEREPYLASDLQTDLDDDLFGERRLFLNDQNVVNLLLAADDETQLVFRIVQTTVETGRIITFYYQSDYLVDRSEGEISSDFILNPPTNVVDYYNFLLVGDDSPFVYCNSDLGGFFFRTSSLIDPTLAGLQDIPLRQLSGSTPCGTSSDDFFSLESDNTAAFNPEATATALFAASVSQDVAGIDPDDTKVTASLFGPVNYAEETLTGDLTARLEFAGRTFQTNARKFDVFDDLSEAVVVKNQDGVILNIFENEEGLASGALTKDGETLGVISEENGIFLVTYTDDTFVSIR